MTHLTDTQRETLVRAFHTLPGAVAAIEAAVEAIVAPYVEALARVEALAEQATEAAYGQIAADKMLTILPTEHGAKVPGHWRDEAEGAASVPVPALRAAAALTPATTEEGR